MASSLATDGAAAPDARQLPFIVQLADDDSPSVQQAVLSALLSYGSELESALAQLEPGIDEAQRTRIDQLLSAHFCAHLRQEWPSWLDESSGPSKLERAFELLAQFQLGLEYSNLGQLLDGLAVDYDSSYSQRNPLSLADFLFKRKNLHGARDDYYNPLNSNLVHVIEQQNGLPISLAAIYILVGRRLGLEIEGCNFPMHFLARTVVSGKTLLVDCFNGGRVVEPSEVGILNRTLPRALRKLITMKVDAEVLICRVLRNLIRAYQEAEHETHRDLMRDLLEDLERHQSQR